MASTNPLPIMSPDTPGPRATLLVTGKKPDHPLSDQQTTDGEAVRFGDVFDKVTTDLTEAFPGSEVTDGDADPELAERQVDADTVMGGEAEGPLDLRQSSGTLSSEKPPVPSLDVGKITLGKDHPAHPLAQTEKPAQSIAEPVAISAQTVKQGLTDLGHQLASDVLVPPDNLRSKQFIQRSETVTSRPRTPAQFLLQSNLPSAKTPEPLSGAATLSDTTSAEALKPIDPKGSPVIASSLGTLPRVEPESLERTGQGEIANAKSGTGDAPDVVDMPSVTSRPSPESASPTPAASLGSSNPSALANVPLLSSGPTRNAQQEIPSIRLQDENAPLDNEAPVATITAPRASPDAKAVSLFTVATPEVQPNSAAPTSLPFDAVAAEEVIPTQTRDAKAVFEPGTMPRVASNPPPPQHIMQQVAIAARSGSGQSVELTLNPAELGHVRISLSTADAGMVVAIHADRPETLDLMRRHVDLLAQEFRDIGFEGAAFSFEGSSGQGGDSTASDPPPDVLNETQDGPTLAHTAAEHTSPIETATDGLDLRL